MAENPMTPPSGVVERNIALTGVVMKYLMSQPCVLASLPDRFELVILPDDDPEMRLYNLDLLDRYGSGDRAIVFARLESHPEVSSLPLQPRLFVPVAV